MSDTGSSQIADQRIAQLRQHEEELVFASFDHHDAWRLGSLIANSAIAEGHGVAIDIRRHDLVLFRCVLPGPTADQEEWIRGRRRRSHGIRAVLRRRPPTGGRQHQDVPQGSRRIDFCP